jgi:hypothetical protein
LRRAPDPHPDGTFRRRSGSNVAANVAVNVATRRAVGAGAIPVLEPNTELLTDLSGHRPEEEGTLPEPLDGHLAKLHAAPILDRLGNSSAASRNRMGSGHVPSVCAVASW